MFNPLILFIAAVQFFHVLPYLLMGLCAIASTSFMSLCTHLATENMCHSFSPYIIIIIVILMWQSISNLIRYGQDIGWIDIIILLTLAAPTIYITMNITFLA